MDAMRLYRWNAAVTSAFWEPIGHLEVALRNSLATQLAARHHRLGRKQTWLDDPDHELSERMRASIAAARGRARQKGKCASEGQIISELNFGFWRFLVTKRSTLLWPDLASAFPCAPNRKRETVERPLARLHDFRNRLAHHQRVWSRNPHKRYEDLLCLAGYIDSELPAWISRTSRVPCALSTSQEGVRRALALERYSGCIQAGGELRRQVRLLRREWHARETSADAILERAGAKRMSPEEFDRNFGDLPTNGEG
jgi:hypothetical protein